MSFPPNLIVAGVLFPLTVIAYWLAREASGDAAALRTSISGGGLVAC